MIKNVHKILFYTESNRSVASLNSVVNIQKYPAVIRAFSFAVFLELSFRNSRSSNESFKKFKFLF